MSRGGRHLGPKKSTQRTRKVYMSGRKSSREATRTKQRVDRAWERLSSPNLLPDVEDQNKRGTREEATEIYYRGAQ